MYQEQKQEEVAEAWLDEEAVEVDELQQEKDNRHVEVQSAS